MGAGDGSASVTMGVAMVVIGRPAVQSCMGEEELWIRGDDGVDLPADDESLGPSGRYIIYTTTITTLYYSFMEVGSFYLFANEFANYSVCERGRVEETGERQIQSSPNVPPLVLHELITTATI